MPPDSCSMEAHPTTGGGSQKLQPGAHCTGQNVYCLLERQLPATPWSSAVPSTFIVLYLPSNAYCLCYSWGHQESRLTYSQNPPKPKCFDINRRLTSLKFNMGTFSPLILVRFPLLTNTMSKSSSGQRGFVWLMCRIAVLP